MTDSTPIWQPSPARLQQANLTRFATARGFAPPDYSALWRWSIAEPDAFCKRFGTTAV